MRKSAKLEVQLVLDGCKRIGISHVVLSPGSRNAPLTIAFDEDPDFEVRVVPDERSAAFQAMGMAQQLGKPVAIACTSGSAPVNYYPAITEAFYQGIPLVVITADRPSAWVDQGDGQTIRQQGVFNNHILAAVQIEKINTEEDRWFTERNLAEVFQTAISEVKGPIHINMPFSEPLYEQTDQSEGIRQWIHRTNEERRLGKSELNSLRELWNTSSKRLVLLGQMEKDTRVNEYLEALALDGSTAVLTEHTGNNASIYFVGCIDRTLNQLTEDELEEYRPDLIVVLGGAIVSKRIKQFVRNSDAIGIRFGAQFPWMDTYKNLVFTSTVDPVIGLEYLWKLTEENPHVSTFGFQWKKKEYVSERAHDLFMQSVVWSDLSVMKYFMEVIPDGANLHISNSSLIRYALLFPPIQAISYWCNRGTSGIDGSSSTAVGAAFIKRKEAHVLLTGDLSFFYDSNAFWINDAPDNLRVVIFNNGGGDIFNIIPGPKTTNQLDKVFVHKHDFDAKGICSSYQLDYYEVRNEEDLGGKIEAFFGLTSNQRPAVMEVFTNKTNNSAVLELYFQTLRKK